MTGDRLPDGRGPSRRGLLRSVGATLAVGATATAGCMASLPPMGQRVRFGRVDVPAASEPVYRDWMPASGELTSVFDEPVDPLERSWFVDLEGPSLADVSGVANIGTSIMLSSLDYFGQGFENYDWAFTPGKGVVLHGDVDTSAVHRTVTETVYEPAGGYRDFETYRRTDEPAWVAVSETDVVFARGEPAEENVRTLIDTGRGEGRRYVDVDEGAATLVDAVGARRASWFQEPGIDESDDGADALPSLPLGYVISETVTDSAVYFLYQYLFPAGEAPTRSAMEDLQEGQSRPQNALSVDVTVDGRVATVEMRMDREDATRDHVFDHPHVTWSQEYDRDAGVVRITHEAGDVIDTSQLDVEGAGTQWQPPGDEIGPGDTLSVEVAPDADGVRFVLSTPDGSGSSTIYTHSLEDV